MKFNFRKISKVKKIFIFVLLLILILLIFIHFFQLTLTVPIGNKYAQFNTSHGSVNIFIPKDNKTILYFHNFNHPESIDISNDTTNFELHANSSFQIRPEQKTEPSKKIEPEIVQNNQKYVKSKILNLTFTAPNNVESSYTLLQGTEVISFRNNYEMSITIRNSNENGCKDSAVNGFGGEKVLLANKIELIFPAEDIDGRKGYVNRSATKFFSEKKACLYVGEKVLTSELFDQILTSAKFE